MGSRRAERAQSSCGAPVSRTLIQPVVSAMSMAGNRIPEALHSRLLGHHYIYHECYWCGAASPHTSACPGAPAFCSEDHAPRPTSRATAAHKAIATVGSTRVKHASDDEDRLRSNCAARANPPHSWAERGGFHAQRHTTDRTKRATRRPKRMRHRRSLPPMSAGRRQIPHLTVQYSSLQESTNVLRGTTGIQFS